MQLHTGQSNQIDNTSPKHKKCLLNNARFHDSNRQDDTHRQNGET